MMVALIQMIFSAGIVGPSLSMLIVVNQVGFSHLYDEEMVAFVDIPEGALTVTRDGPSKSCFSCLHKAKEDSLADIIIGTEETTIYGIKYHVHDFVYIHPGLTSGSILLEIGQITKFQKQQVAVRLLGRYDEYVKYQKKLQSSDCDLIADEVSGLGFCTGLNFDRCYLSTRGGCT